jgi:hypothetical protein
MIHVFKMFSSIDPNIIPNADIFVEDSIADITAVANT